MKVQCKSCLDIIESKHRHDFKWCKCESICIDGGNDYLKLGYPDGNVEDHIEMDENKFVN